jgi:septum site-determining protein MinD
MVLVCDQLREDMDYIVIDSPAGIERGFRNAIAPADQVIVVTNPEVSAVRDADRIVGLLEAEEKGSGKLVINRLKPQMVARGDMLSVEDVLDILAIPLLGVIPEDEKILVASNQGLPLAMNGVNGSSAGQAFRDVARRLEGEETPFLDLTAKQGFIERLRQWVGGTN